MTGATSASPTGILGKSSTPSKLVTAKFSAIQLFVFKKKKQKAHYLSIIKHPYSHISKY
jgi:hypothetical protein